MHSGSRKAFAVSGPGAASWRLRDKGEYLLFLAGVNLMLLNFTMVQHATIAFRRAEVAVVVVTLSYFAGISLGYLLSDRIAAGTIRALLPALMGVQMAMILFLQPLFYLAARGLGTAFAYALVFLLMTAGVTSLYSIFLPRVIQLHGGELGRCYSIEIAGSLLGLLAVPLLASVSHRCLLGVYFAVFVSIGAALGGGRRLVGGLASAGAIFLIIFPHGDRASAAWFYRHRYRRDVRGVAHTRYTPYHKIEVLDLGGGEHMLVLNAKRQFAKASHYTYSYFVAEYPARLLDHPRVCVLGCGSMSTVGRIGEMASSVRIVDIDPGVFEAARQYFRRYNRLDELENWEFIADDAKHFLANTHERFDLILHDIPPARSRQVALTYTLEFFQLVRSRLSPGGIFSIASLTPLEADSRYGRRLVATLAQVFEDYCVFSRAGAAYFYGRAAGGKPWGEQELLEAVEHSRRRGVRVYAKEEVEKLVRGARIITLNNVGDLIYE